MCFGISKFGVLKKTYKAAMTFCAPSPLFAAQNAVDDDDEMFVEPPEDLDLGAQMRRKAELIRIREAQEAALMDQSFSFCWNSTLGFKMRNSTVLNLHRYASSPLNFLEFATSAQTAVGFVVRSRFLLRICSRQIIRTVSSMVARAII